MNPKYLYRIALLIFAICPILLKAQVKVNGIVVDEKDGAPLKNASICLIGASDSILYYFQRSDKKGNFRFDGIKPAKYLLKVTYPGSIDFADTVNYLNGNSFRNDTIKLINGIIAIKEILITKYNNGLRISGDTTEYLADFFKTNPGATVEDLLKKLPGIQVNKNGEITAQGKQIQKILVDGEEFFPDDPSIATKYLRADMIDKVQVYDEKKDTMAATNQEENTRTLNLTLKDGKKKGSFGRLEAGSDFENYLNGGLFAGYFNKNIKAAGFAKSSNFENASLGWRDRNQFGSTATGGGNSYYSDGLMYTTRGGSDFDDQLDSRGIPNNTTIGAIFNDKLSKKVNLNSSYRYANEGLNGTITKSSRYFLPDTQYEILDTTVNKSNQVGHRLNTNLKFDPDSLNTITFNNSVGMNNGFSNAVLGANTSSSQLINNNQRQSDKTYSKLQYNGTLSWQKRYKKPSKTLTINAGLGYAPSEQHKTLKSTSRFYNEKGQIQETQNLDQTTDLEIGSLSANGDINYSNTISKKISYSLTYSVSSLKESNTTNTYSAENGSAKAFVDSLSSGFDLNQQQHKAGGSLYYKLKKMSYWISLNGGYLQFSQTDRKTNIKRQTPYYNLIPSAGIGYSWKKQSRIGLSYSGSNSPPPISAIQPLVNNTDPMNITVGNPNLKQSFNNRFSVDLNSFQTLKGRYLWGYLSGNFPKNALVNASWVDSNVVRRNMTVNANGNYSVYASLNYNFRLKKLPLYFSFGFSGNVSRNITFFNSEEVVTLSQSMSPDFGVDIETDNFEFGLEYQISYNRNSSSLSNQNGNNYLIHTPNYYIEAKLPKKFEVYSEGDFNIRPASDVFASRNVFYLNGGVRKQFGKKNNFELAFHINDMLNQNVGFFRNISTNLVSEELYTQLSRYWLIKARWNFTSAGGDDD